MTKTYDVVIVGGGPAGMMAAIQASKKTQSICLLERNQSLGKKLLLTGKGRCNLTTAKTIPEIVQAFGPKGGFLHSALARFSNQDLIGWFQQRGVKTKIERGQRVFPIADKATTILNCLIKELQKQKVSILYQWRITSISRKKIFALTAESGSKISAKKVIIATGGMSYPATGSTGDGYQLSRQLGHHIIPPQPALAALFTKEKEVKNLAGLTLKNVKLTYQNSKNKKTISIFGEMLFTHQGISGPIVLTTSKQIYQWLEDYGKITAHIDLKPALDKKTLQARLIREIHSAPKKEYQSLLKKLLPKSLIPFLIKKTGIEAHRKSGYLNPQEIPTIITSLKNLSFGINQVAPIQTAIVTSGGVDIDQINQRTMESIICPDLYFAGEIIALDAPTGGFNLQKAFSTGWLAGTNAVAPQIQK